MAKSRPVQPRHDDVAFLKDSDSWPNWPVCPVKKYNQQSRMPDCGLVFAGCTRVVMLNMWKPWTPEEYEAATKHEYESFDAMAADGWVVD